MVVFTTNSFNKDISKIRDKKIAERAEQVIKKLETVKSISEIPGIKKMAGAPNAYRIRIGEYRLGFFLIDNAILAKKLDIPLDLALSKKIEHPGNKEYAIGSVSLDSAIISDSEGVPEDYIHKEVCIQKPKII